MIHRTLSVTLTMMLLSLGLGVMSSGCDSINRSVDCQDICARYSDCFDSTYDVSACQSRCDDSATNNANFDQQVKNCSNCIDDRSCTSTAFACTLECSGIVP